MVSACVDEIGLQEEAVSPAGVDEVANAAVERPPPEEPVETRRAFGARRPYGKGDDNALNVWASRDGLIDGFDGELYEGYLPRTIRRTQRGLRSRGLYDGPIHGVLDQRTMEAIYAFQAASPGLQRCGVPTPRTRTLLEQGSHTF